MSESELSTKEQDILKKFKEQISDLIKPTDTDEDIVRWLRARNFDLEKSEEMIRKSMKWRKTWGADTILTSWKLPEVLDKYDIGSHCGFDKEGCPVWIYPSALLDMKGLVLAARKDDILKCYIQKLETNQQICKEQSEKLGRRIDKVVLINDLENFTMSHLLQPGMSIKLKILAMTESNYPESLKKAYIVNAPSIFPLIYKLIKPFINEPTRKRIVILGKDWKTKLHEIIDPDQLPVYWGGTMTDPVDGNEFCSSKMKLGGSIPPSYYLKGSHLVDEKLLTKTTVSSGDKLKLQFQVSQANQVLRYTFWTEKYDIKFGVKFRRSEDDSEAESIVPVHKVDSNLVPEDGAVECENIGIYEVVFDNRYSWFHSKNLSYYVYVLNPDTIEANENSAVIDADKNTGVIQREQVSTGGADGQ